MREIGAGRRRRLIVALHDVAPPFEAEIRAQLDALASIGVDRCVLLVVPNWHGAHPLTAATSLVGLLRRQVESGSELVLHGLEHRRRGALRGPVHLRLRAGLFAPDACEFLSLSREEVMRSLRDGCQHFLNAGLIPPSTFCAPGWLLSPDLPAVLAEGGMHRVVGMFSLYDLDSSRRSILPSLGYMGGGTVHEAAIRASNRLVRLALPALGVLQVYLHPQGGVTSPGARRVLETVRQVIEAGWQPATYEEAVQQRART